MAKVICTLPNASELISGIEFVAHKLGMISAEISDDVAAEFASIAGYLLVGDTSTEDAAALDAMKARADAIGLKTDTRWKLERMTAEVEKAEKAAAAGTAGVAK